MTVKTCIEFELNGGLRSCKLFVDRVKTTIVKCRGRYGD